MINWLLNPRFEFAFNTFLLLKSHIRNCNFPAFLIRKQPKEWQFCLCLHITLEGSKAFKHSTQEHKLNQSVLSFRQMFDFFQTIRILLTHLYLFEGGI